jgi:flagellar biosynthesis/type III secretory pathway protein FliH
MGMRKVEPIMKRLQAGLNQLATFRGELREKYEKLAVHLALLFAETIVLKECSQCGEAVADMVTRALEICEDRTDMVVRVRNSDLEYLGQSLPFKVVADDTLKEPGFVMETSFGDIDGRISTQIEELRKEFFNGHSG